MQPSNCRRRHPGLFSATVLLCGLTLGATGCKMRVDKSEDGQNVKIATPFGSIAVNKNQTSAADVGLPAYPGATLETSRDGNDSARVDMGFGSWKLRVRVAHYESTDSRDQVIAFYRKALNAFGPVIQCEGERSVGPVTVTAQGLNCDDDAGKHNNPDSGELQLKAGSPHHQHLVVFHSGSGSPTHFSLIALELPHGENTGQSTN